MLRRLFALRHYCLFRAELAAVPMAADGPAAYEFRALEAADFACSPIAQEKGRAARFAQRLAAGHRSFGFVAPGRGGPAIAFYLWLSGGATGPGQVPLGLGLSLGLTSDLAYIWDCRTAPEHRRKRLYQQALRHALAIAEADGAKLALMAAERDNRASRAGIVSAGFHEAAIVRLARLGPVLALTGGCGPRLLIGREVSLPWRELLGPTA